LKTKHGPAFAEQLIKRQTLSNKSCCTHLIVNHIPTMTTNQRLADESIHIEPSLADQPLAKAPPIIPDTPWPCLFPITPWQAGVIVENHETSSKDMDGQAWGVITTISVNSMDGSPFVIHGRTLESSQAEEKQPSGVYFSTLPPRLSFVKHFLTSRNRPTTTSTTSNPIVVNAIYDDSQTFFVIEDLQIASILRAPTIGVGTTVWLKPLSVLTIVIQIVGETDDDLCYQLEEERRGEIVPHTLHVPKEDWSVPRHVS
jgi:hypothetical protein